MNMNAYTAVCIMNLGIMLLCGIVAYITMSPWALVGLVFMTYTETKCCPKCGEQLEEAKD